MCFKYFIHPIGLLFFFSFTGCKSPQVAKLDFSDGSYEGSLNNDKEKHDFGIYRWIDGSIYEGEYQNDFRHGKGRFLWANGESYTGDYLKDQRTGIGIYNWPDGSLYEGEFFGGQRHGIGTYKAADGTVYEGEWFDDVQHGQGTLTNSDGVKVRGIWRKGNLITKPSNLPTSSTKPQLPKVSLEELAVESDAVVLTAKKASWKKVQPKPSDQVTLPSDHKLREPNSPSSEVSDMPPLISSPEVQLSSATDSALKKLDEKKVEASPLMSSPSNKEEKPDWSGTAANAEREFLTELVDGIDTVRRRSDGIPFSGRMEILDSNGNILGQVNLLDGRLHGEEVFYNNTGEIIEKNLWSNGRKIGN